MAEKYIRKSHKKQIESVLETLDKAHDAIEKALKMQSGEAALLLLEQCQDSAIQIGNMIEGSLGEDFATVELLENYCEQIYQTYELIRQKRPLNVNKIHKILRKELIRIQNSVKYDILIRRVALFLPYKASMWDSLESVWKAADADPDCDAYVVPIPYFDKNVDGSFGEMHYEGNEYPEYVPITSWEEYDIEAEHPDMIFIHNPYDEFNHVTSVLPMYYSKELRNFTDLLVYIPYFILGDIDPNDKESVESVEHFCTVPAVVYADKVIVQSKNWRQIYINVMTKTMGSDTRKVWEAKILGLGSPKIDKVYTTVKESIEIPEEWQKIIQKPDGSWKRIIFYNTSVSALLQHSEKMLKKMEYVFRIFKENQDEVALLWRPHPLIKATIESMRPQLWIEYEKIVKKYVDEGWGIYDDTADMNRAIAISDAYYGDRSSVVKLCEETDKPVMLQDIQVLEPKRYQYDIAATESICEYREDYYFVFTEEPAFCRMNPKTLECELLYVLNEEGLQQRLYRKIIPYRSKLFLIPFLSNYVAVYDIETNEIEFVHLDTKYVDIYGQKFSDALVQDGFLYMIPHMHHAFVKMDMESLEIVEIPLGHQKGSEAFSYCLGSGCLWENRVIFPIASEGSICVYDIALGKIEKVFPIGNEKKYSNVFLIDNVLWLIPMKIYEGIDIWDAASGNIVENVKLEKVDALSRQHKGMDFRTGYIINRKLYLLSCGLECSVIIDLDRKTEEIWTLPYIYEPNEFPPYRYSIRYSSVMQQEQGAIISGLRGEWMKCEGNRVHIIERQSVWSDDLRKVLLKRKLGKVMLEENVDLADYIRVKMDIEEHEKDRDVSNGERIYAHMK